MFCRVLFVLLLRTVYLSTPVLFCRSVCLRVGAVLLVFVLSCRGVTSGALFARSCCLASFSLRAVALACLFCCSRCLCSCARQARVRVCAGCALDQLSLRHVLLDLCASVVAVPISGVLSCILCVVCGVRVYCLCVFFISFSIAGGGSPCVLGSVLIFLEPVVGRVCVRMDVSWSVGVTLQVWFCVHSVGRVVFWSLC